MTTLKMLVVKVPFRRREPVLGSGSACLLLRLKADGPDTASSGQRKAERQGWFGACALTAGGWSDLRNYRKEGDALRDERLRLTAGAAASSVAPTPFATSAS